MNVLRRSLGAWVGILLVWVAVIGLFISGQPQVKPAWAQEPPPTKPPLEQPTKPPVEPPPTKEQVPPTAVPPTKEPLPTDAPTKAPTRVPTKTLWPTTLPTKTALPIVLPTKTDLPTSGAAPQSAPASTPIVSPVGQDPTGRTTPQVSAVRDVPLPASAEAVTTISGIVFEDANDNGQRDPGESGLSGVAVSVETPAGVKTTVTDARGAYALPALVGATVHISVPAGWSTRQAESQPIERAGDFPLRTTRVAEARPPAALTPLTITQSVIDFAPLIALGVGLGVVMAFGFLRTSRAVSVSNRALALLLVRMQRTSEKPLTFEAEGPQRATNARVLTLLNQAVLDAVGRPLHIERVLTLTAGERPAITALGQDGRAAFIVLTPLEAKVFQRAWRSTPAAHGNEVTFEHATAYPLERLGEALAAGHGTAYPLDALNSGLFVADDLAAAYAYLAADLPVSARTLPRTARWTLFVVPLPKNDLAVRERWRYRIARRLRP